MHKQFYLFHCVHRIQFSRSASCLSQHHALHHHHRDTDRRGLNRLSTDRRQPRIRHLVSFVPTLSSTAVYHSEDCLSTLCFRANSPTSIGVLSAWHPAVHREGQTFYHVDSLLSTSFFAAQSALNFEVDFSPPHPLRARQPESSKSFEAISNSLSCPPRRAFATPFPARLPKFSKSFLAISTRRLARPGGAVRRAPKRNANVDIA